MNKRQKLVQKHFLNNEKAVIQRLQGIYGDSLKEIQDKIKNLSFSIGKLQQEYDWLDPSDPKRAEIKSMIQSKIYQKQYQAQLEKQVDGILKRIRVAQIDNIEDYLDTCYSDAFIGTIFDAHGQGVPILAPINQESMVRAVQLESKISKGLYTKLGQDVNLLKTRIMAEVSRGISTGKSYAQVAKGLENQSRIGFNRAVRIARTEGHRIQCTAAMDAMEAAKERGADVLKQWDSTLDGRTRDSHAMVDGEIRELDKKFSNGLMFAGDPNGVAGEVINCRCAVLQRARWALDEDELQVLKDKARYFGVDKTDEFEDFKKKFLKAADAGVGESVMGLKAPVRPKRSDFDDDESYMVARDQYRKDRERYQAQIDDAVQNNLNKTRQFTTKSDVEQWAKKHGIDISDDVFENVDIRAFDDYIKTTEELLKKYPDVLNSIENIGGRYRILLSDFDDELASADGGFRFGRKFKNYEDVLKEQLNAITRDYMVQGDGTIKGLYRHEFGHNLKFAIEQSIESTSKRVEFKQDIVRSLKNAKGVSEYGLTNEEELFAEGFAAFESGVNTELAEEFGKLISRWRISKK